MSNKFRNEMVFGVILAAVFVIIGSGLIAVGMDIHKQHSALKAQGKMTTGVVIRFERIGKRGGAELKETILVPVVKFVTLSDQEVTFRGSINSKPFWADYRPGESVTVIYDPEYPKDAKIDTFAEIWFAPLLLWAIGCSAVLIPPWTIWRHIKEKKTSHGQVGL